MDRPGRNGRVRNVPRRYSRVKPSPEIVEWALRIGFGLPDEGGTSYYQWQYQLNRKFAMTVEDYLTLFEEQDGRCGICHEEFDFEALFPGVDHDHDSGIIRGLLCTGCNRNLGWAERVGTKSIQDYLERRSKHRVIVARTTRSDKRKGKATTPWYRT